jgi:hypothetical protein
MHIMNQLSGYTRATTTISSAWLLVLALLGAVGFVTLHYAPPGLFSENGSSAQEYTEPPARLSSPKTEDQLRHLDNAIAALKEASSAIARSHDWTDRALSSLDDPALTARRLQVARSASRSAEAQIDRAYSEIEITNGTLTERKSK